MRDNMAVSLAVPTSAGGLPARQGSAFLGSTRYAESYAAISDDELAAPIFRGDDVPLRPSLYPVLHALYCEKISRLSDYLGADLSGWLQA